MTPIEILGKIVDLIQANPNKTILDIYRDAFNEKDIVILFKLRALLIEQIEEVIKSVPESKHTSKAFNDLYVGLTQSNLSLTSNYINTYFTSGNVASVGLAFEIKEFKQDFNAINEIVQLKTDLQDSIADEDITQEEEEILLEICYEIDKAAFEHKITGNTAIRKLQEIQPSVNYMK